MGYALSIRRQHSTVLDLRITVVSHVLEALELNQLDVSWLSNDKQNVVSLSIMKLNFLSVMLLITFYKTTIIFVTVIQDSFSLCNSQVYCQLLLHSGNEDCTVFG